MRHIFIFLDLSEKLDFHLEVVGKRFGENCVNLWKCIKLAKFDKNRVNYQLKVSCLNYSKFLTDIP